MVPFKDKELPVLQHNTDILKDSSVHETSRTTDQQHNIISQKTTTPLSSNLSLSIIRYPDSSSNRSKKMHYGLVSEIKPLNPATQ